MRLEADEIGLMGLWHEDQEGTALPGSPDRWEEGEIPLFFEVRRWLSIYFSGKNPAFSVPLHLVGTAFQLEVWAMLQTIPYGQTTTYGAIARQLAAKPGRGRMSPQAVGGAVGRNPVSILVPCHRVVGTKGSLTGYAGGIGRKQALLTLEHVDMGGLWLPKTKIPL